MDVPRVKKERRAIVLLVLLMAPVYTGCLEEFDVRPFADERLVKAAAFASGQIFPDLVVQIHHPPGWGPMPEALDHYATTLREVTSKQSIRIEVDEFPEGTSYSRVWTIHQIGELHERLHPLSDTGCYGLGDTAYLHVMYLPGQSSEREYGSAAGTWNTIFIEQIRTVPPWSPHWPPVEGEKRVLVHEAGHAMGLVDHGAPMVHARLSEDGYHSARPESVMYVGVVGTALPATNVRVDGRYSSRFDAYDLQDLAALEEKVAELMTRRDPRAEWACEPGVHVR